jgi:hypothetical protein
MATCNSSLVGTINDNNIVYGNLTTNYSYYLLSGSMYSHLLACTGLSSLSGNYSFTVRSDGNLILYDHVQKKIIWESKTQQSRDGYAKLSLTNNGKLILEYSPTLGGNNTTIWESDNTSTTNVTPTKLTLSDTGVLSIYDMNQHTNIWTNPVTPPAVSLDTGTAGVSNGTTGSGVSNGTAGVSNGTGGVSSGTTDTNIANAVIAAYSAAVNTIGNAAASTVGSAAASVATTTLEPTTLRTTTKSTTTSSSGTTTPTTSTTTLLFEVGGAFICVIGCVFVLISFLLIIQQNN